MTDPLIIAGTQLRSRLFVGTAGYPNQQVLLDSLEASGAELVTASIRRISLDGYAESSSTCSATGIASCRTPRAASPRATRS